ncbi:unnamed protein product [Orchesella dallaii]|uniref:Uncharacterized protein n=1 Tax=Orchesella dallaii TaxID=48710 RepID=A0ABP1QY80_9HEXA
MENRRSPTQSLPVNNGISGKIFKYLQKTVAGFLQPFTTQIDQIPLQHAFVEEDGNNTSINIPIATQTSGSTMTLKRRKSITPGPQRKACKKILKTSSIDMINSNLSSECICSCELESCNCVSQTFDLVTDKQQQLNALFSTFLWKLKCLEVTPLRTNDEMTLMITTFCKGICDILNLSRLSFTDRQYRRVLRITDTLFDACNSYRKENTLMSMTYIYDKIECVVDSFLDQLKQENLSVEHQIYQYGFISGLIVATNDIEIRKLLVEKLLVRIHSAVFSMWTAYIFCKDSQVMDPDVINLFYLYCQLLEATITTSNWESQQNWLLDNVHRYLVNLEEAAGSLFAQLPNLTYILYSVILAAKQGSEAGTTSTTPLE